MGNKTIYVKDDATWERAKKLAGKEGLSSVIGEALARYVAEKEEQADGYEKHTIRLADSPDVYAFVGKHLVKFYVSEGLSKLDCYLTKGRKIVVVTYSLRQISDVGPELCPIRVASYTSLKQLADDIDFTKLVPGYVGEPEPELEKEFREEVRENRDKFFEALVAALGTDWAVWID